MKKLIIAVGLLLSLAACASYTAPATPQQTSSIKTIGLVSTVGGSMTYKYIGITVFTNDETTGDTSKWGVDQFALEQITAKLNSRYKTVPIEINQENFNTSEAAIGERLRAALKPGQPPVDAYLLLYPTTSGDYISQSNQMLFGLGVYRRRGASIQVYAASDLLLIDAHSFAILGGGQLGFATTEITTGDYLSGRALSKSMMGGELSHRKINPKLAVAKAWSEFTLEQLEEVKADIKALLKDSLDYPITSIGLGK